MSCTPLNCNALQLRYVLQNEQPLRSIKCSTFLSNVPCCLTFPEFILECVVHVFGWQIHFS